MIGMQQQTLVACSATFILGAIVGAYATHYMVEQSSGQETGTSPTFDAGWQAALDAVHSGKEFGMDSRLVTDMAPVLQMTGLITAIDGATITIAMNDPLLMTDPTLYTRVVTLTDATELIQLYDKDPGQLQRELDMHSTALPNNGENYEDPSQMIDLPDPFVRSAVSSEGLEEGQVIVVHATSDVRGVRTVVAEKIEIQPSFRPVDI